jgi:OOP family OmpA-OmpF porin
MKKKITFSLLSALALPVIGVCSLHAQAKQVFGEVWRDAIIAAPDQARVVYYRPASLSDQRPAHIYVDGEFQSALLPNGFTDFCVAPGKHSLGSYVGDAPHYNGKTIQPWRDTLQAGKTYYVRANLDNSGRPLVINSELALGEMVGLKKQRHVLSRASAVQACRGGSNQTYENYAFSSDLLFRFKGHRVEDIQGEGNKALGTFVEMLKSRGMTHNRIKVTGYTDPIGDEKSNQVLGQRRADTVKKVLIDNGIEAGKITVNSMGESQSNKQCNGSQNELIQCYASERRVVISVEN